MTANNETGVLQPVEQIGRVAAEADVHFHTDAVQAFGKVPLNVDSTGCDLLAISGHKLHAPQEWGRCTCEGNPVTTHVVWRSPRALAPRRDRKRSGYRRTRQGRELARARMTRGESEMAPMRDRLEQALFADRQCGREWRRRPTRPANVEHLS